jgi:alpha/beta superfamily hydrolase
MNLRTDDGLTLEAIVDGPADATAGIVLCHPHPKMGGSMRAPFLDVVASTLAGRGYRVLRFNTRGTDLSEGEFGGGEAEALDLAAAWEAIGTPQRGLAGWSFGARLAMAHAATSAAPAALFAPPVGGGSGGRSRPAAPTATNDHTDAPPDRGGPPGQTGSGNGLPDLAKPLGPCVVVVGDRDQFVPAAEVEAFFGEAPIVLKGCDHFFIGRFAEQAAEAAADFFAAELPLA